MKQFSLIISFLLLSLVSMAQYTGSLPVTLSGVPGGATSIQWFKDGAAISGANAATYAAPTAGNYYATFTDASTACTDDRTASFVLLNSGGSAALNGSTNNGTGSAYQWYNAGAAVSGANTANYTATTGGLYSLKYNNGTCEIETAKTYVFVASANAAPVGNVDNICTVVGGWSYDTSSPATSIDVIIYVRNAATNALIQAHVVKANQPRPDVNTAFGITGDHGYNFDLIPLYNGQNVKVEVYAIGSGSNNTLLTGSGGNCNVPPCNAGSTAPVLVKN